MTEYMGLNEDNAIICTGRYDTDQIAIESLSKHEEVVVIETVRLVEARGPKLPGVKFKTNQFVVIWTKYSGATTEEEQMNHDGEDQRDASAQDESPQSQSTDDWLKGKSVADKPIVTEEEAVKMRAKIKAAEWAADDFYTALNCIEHELIVQFFEPLEGPLLPIRKGVSRAILRAKREVVILQRELGTVRAEPPVQF